MEQEAHEHHKSHPRMTYLILTLRSFRELSATAAAVGVLWAIIQGAATFPIEWKAFKQDVTILKTIEIPNIKSQSADLKSQNLVILKDIGYMRDSMIEMKVLLEKVLDRQYEESRRSQ